MGGCWVKWAQSSGEWPGSRRTFLEGRLEGASVDVETDAVTEDGEGAARGWEGGTRRLAATDGGG